MSGERTCRGSGMWKPVMQITKEAEVRLRELVERCGPKNTGLSFEGCVGTCRGSTPQLCPAKGARADQQILKVAGITFYADEACAEMLRVATLDYEGGFLGRGLVMTWPHQEGGCPNCRNWPG